MSEIHKSEQFGANLKVVIPDDIGGSYAASPHLAKLKSLGAVEIFDDKPRNEEALADRIAEADVVVSFRPAFTRFPRQVLEKCRLLRILSTSGTSVGDIDVAAATDAGIAIANVPGAANRSVAEHCLALMLAVARNISSQDRAIRSGEWRSVEGIELSGRTLGLVGLGGIGSELSRIAANLGMTVLSWSRGNSETRAAAVGSKAVSLDQLLGQSDVVSLHLTLTPDTAGFVDVNFFKRMKAGAIFINAARGGLVDLEALSTALREGRLRGAGLDVFPTEPLPKKDRLLDTPNVVMTPVSAWNTADAADRMIGISLDNVVAFLHGTSQNVCNKPMEKGGVLK